MNRSDKFAEIRMIADAICDGESTPEQLKRLEACLNESNEAKKFYLEYVTMHSQLKGTSASDIEVVMRKIQMEEVIVRSKQDRVQTTIPPKPFDTPRLEIIPHRKKSLAWGSLIALLTIATIYLYTQSKSDFIYLSKGRVQNTGGSGFEKVSLQPGEYTTLNEVFLKVNSEVELVLDSNSRFGVLYEKELKFFSGRVIRNNDSGGFLTLKTNEFKLISESSAFELNYANTSETTIASFGDKNHLIPFRWQPKHYWSFDQKHDRALDAINQSDGILSNKTEWVKGLVGQGAYFFNNTQNSMIDLGSGGGTALATGSFSVTDGISLEAMIHSHWNGKDYDEIFRKEKDGGLRVMLSFQNDWGTHSELTFPKIEEGPVLSFGLHLVGHGYQELEMLLDGKNGSMTLEQLKEKPRHLVASYNTKTGLKAIYIDGKIVASYQYEAGTRVLSGGPGNASIGNHPSSKSEPFHGIIDEVAFYDFALTSFLIQRHYENVHQGLNYYGFKPNLKSLDLKNYKISLPKDGEFSIDNTTGLPEYKKK